MSEFTIYGVPGSPYVRAALLGLEEKGCDWRFHAMAFGAFKAPEHLQRHPFGRIPVMDHGDFRLYEVQAILRYLDRGIMGILGPHIATEADARQLIRACYFGPLGERSVRAEEPLLRHGPGHGQLREGLLEAGVRVARGRRTGR